MTKQITITNRTAAGAVIEIEGVIGVPEKWQFENPEQRVATYETFRKKVEEIKKLDAKEVVVNIRSTGGNVNDALLIFDALQGLRAKVTTRCYGYVASAATVIAQAASQGAREISGNSLYLIHRSVCSTEGNRQELERTLDMLGKTDQRIAAVYAGRSGRKAAEFAALMGENCGNGRWLSPNEVVELGLADKIIAASPIKADAKAMVSELGLPPVPKDRKEIGSEIARQWNTVLGALGINKAPADAKESGEESQGVENAPEKEAAGDLAEVPNNAAAGLAEVAKKETARSARLAAKATGTKPKEDPSPQEMTFSQNEEAYLNDLKRFV